MYQQNNYAAGLHKPYFQVILLWTEMSTLLCPAYFTIPLLSSGI